MDRKITQEHASNHKTQIKPKTYLRELRTLQTRLVEMQEWVRMNGANGPGIDCLATRGRALTMKLLKAIVRPDRVDAVREAVNASGVSGMTVTEVRGHGQQKGHTAIYRGQEYEVSLLPKYEVAVVVANWQADDVTAAMIEAARTGQIGDGRVFVSDVEQSYRIRTGELLAD